MNRSAVIGVYKNVRRSAEIAFKGDSQALAAARARIRSEFEQNRTEVNPKKIEKTAGQVAHILRHNLVQGQKKEDAGNVYKLKIDPDRHEMGDNDSRYGKKTSTPDPCGCHTCIE